jgi:NADPH:quinone reductase-like Zn-dependent oxidoreductase
MPKAVRFSEYGGVEVLHIVEVPELRPARGQARIAVRAAGVNPVDWKVMHGNFSGGEALASPTGLGSDVAGVIEELGEGVEALKVGDQVLGRASTPAYAEQALCDVVNLVVKPAAMAWDIAGGLTVVSGTAYKLLKLLEVSDGETLLIHAAAGGVGMMAAQLAVRRGASVIGTASVANHDFLRSLGVIPVAYGEGLAERVRALAPSGVDAVLDASGRGELAMSVELAGGADRVITIAAGDAAAHGVEFHGGGGGEDTIPALEEVTALIADGQLQFPIWRTYPLSQTAEALAESESGHARGKIVLTAD